MLQDVVREPRGIHSQSAGGTASVVTSSRHLRQLRRYTSCTTWCLHVPAVTTRRTGLVRWYTDSRSQGLGPVLPRCVT